MVTPDMSYSSLNSFTFCSEWCRSTTILKNH